MSRQSPNGTYWKKRAKFYEEALSHVLWIKDCGIDGRDPEDGVFKNFPAAERDAMYRIAKDALGAYKVNNRNDAASFTDKEKK